LEHGASATTTTASWPTLHPRLAEAGALDALSERWRTRRRMRIEDALAPGLAEAIVASAGQLPFSFFERHEGEIHCVLWRQPHALEGDARGFAAMPELRRLLTVDLPALASAITAQALGPAPGGHFAIDYYTRGSYLDAHSDRGPDRLVAYVVGLTGERWPAERGGHLEFLAPDEETVIERVAPGFGSLDLFCIYPLTAPHRVPLLRDPVTRLSINGWLDGELKGPGEA
jgi:hypothetical protein